MTDEVGRVADDATTENVFETHRFALLVGGVILISLFMVSVAISLYNTSGAAQLDLSRPGYKDVRKQVTYEASEVSFPANGPLDKEALESFRKLYAARAKKISGTDSFDASALSEESLQLLATGDQLAPSN